MALKQIMGIGAIRFYRWIIVGAILCLIAAAITLWRRNCHQTPKQGIQYACLIGVDKYQDPAARPLPDVAASVDKLSHLFVKTGIVQQQNIKILHGDGDGRPTREAILTQLRNLSSQTSSDDIVLILFCGHGKVINGKTHLLPWDTSWQSLQSAQETTLSSDTISKALFNVPAKLLIVSYEMCRVDFWQDPTLYQPLNSTIIKDMTLKPSPQSKAKSIVTIFSCGDGEVTYSSRKWQVGYFDFFLGEGLRGRAADAQGTVRLKNLLQYLRKGTYATVRLDTGKRQTPQWNIESADVQGTLNTVLTTGHQPASGGETAMGVMAESYDVPRESRNSSGRRTKPELKIWRNYVRALHHAYEFILDRRFTEALKMFRKASRIYPQQARSWYEIALLQDEAFHNYRAADRAYMEALKREPEWAWLHSQIAILNMVHHLDYKKAETHFRRTIQLKPSESSYYNLGNLYYGAGRLRAAEECYLKALHLKPHYQPAVEMLTSLRAKMKSKMRKSTYPSMNH